MTKKISYFFLFAFLGIGQIYAQISQKAKEINTDCLKKFAVLKPSQQDKSEQGIPYSVFVLREGSTWIVAVTDTGSFYSFRKMRKVDTLTPNSSAFDLNLCKLLEKPERFVLKEKSAKIGDIDVPHYYTLNNEGGKRFGAMQQAETGVKNLSAMGKGLAFIGNGIVGVFSVFKPTKLLKQVEGLKKQVSDQQALIKKQTDEIKKQTDEMKKQTDLVKKQSEEMKKLQEETAKLKKQQEEAIKAQEQAKAELEKAKEEAKKNPAKTGKEPKKEEKKKEPKKQEPAKEEKKEEPAKEEKKEEPTKEEKKEEPTKEEKKEEPAKIISVLPEEDLSKLSKKERKKRKKEIEKKKKEQQKNNKNNEPNLKPYPNLNKENQNKEEKQNPVSKKNKDKQDSVQIRIDQTLENIDALQRKNDLEKQKSDPKAKINAVSEEDLSKLSKKERKKRKKEIEKKKKEQQKNNELNLKPYPHLNKENNNEKQNEDKKPDTETKKSTKYHTQEADTTKPNKQNLISKKNGGTEDSVQVHIAKTLKNIDALQRKYALEKQKLDFEAQKAELLRKQRELETGKEESTSKELLTLQGVKNKHLQSLKDKVTELNTLLVKIKNSEDDALKYQVPAIRQKRQELEKEILIFEKEKPAGKTEETLKD